jgi:hypothetical protein
VDYCCTSAGASLVAHPYPESSKIVAWAIRPGGSRTRELILIAGRTDSFGDAGRPDESIPIANGEIYPEPRDLPVVYEQSSVLERGINWV